MLLDFMPVPVVPYLSSVENQAQVLNSCFKEYQRFYGYISWEGHRSNRWTRPHVLGTAKASEVGGSVREHVDQIGYMIVYESYEYIMYNIRMYIYICVCGSCPVTTAAPWQRWCFSSTNLMWAADGNYISDDGEEEDDDDDYDILWSWRWWWCWWSSDHQIIHHHHHHHHHHHRTVQD